MIWRKDKDEIPDEDSEKSKGVYAKDEEEAKEIADRIGKQEGYEGEPEIEEKPDASGGSWWNITWGK